MIPCSAFRFPRPTMPYRRGESGHKTLYEMELLTRPPLEMGGYSVLRVAYSVTTHDKVRSLEHLC
jgi:hypothetical protein